MNSTIAKCALCAVVAGIASSELSAKTETWGDEKYRPKLFKRFGDIVNVPDGLTKGYKDFIELLADKDIVIIFHKISKDRTNEKR